jgi:hypothetical protein
MEKTLTLNPVTMPELTAVEGGTGGLAGVATIVIGWAVWKGLDALWEYGKDKKGCHWEGDMRICNETE